jgi:hypothetical protein
MTQRQHRGTTRPDFKSRYRVTGAASAVGFVTKAIGHLVPGFVFGTWNAIDIRIDLPHSLNPLSPGQHISPELVEELHVFIDGR